MIPEYYKTQRWMLEQTHDVLAADILALMYGNGKDDWKFDMTVPEMADYFFVNKRTLMREIQKLEQLGLIETERGKGKKNIYKVVTNCHHLGSDKKSPEQCQIVTTTSDKKSPPLADINISVNKSVSVINQNDNQLNQSARGAGECGELSPSPSTETDTEAADRTFKEFWEAYPADRRTSESYCRKLWRKIPNIGHQAKWIIASITVLKQGDHWINQKGYWVPQTENFIAKELWKVAEKDFVLQELARPDHTDVDQAELDQFADENQAHRRDKDKDVSIEEFDALAAELGL